MVKMQVLYRKPDDAETFEKRYVEGHLPLVQKYGNIKDTSFSRVKRVLMGDYPYAYVFTAKWADNDGFKADMNSAEAAAATEDAKTFAPPFDVVVFEEIA